MIRRFAFLMFAVAVVGCQKFAPKDPGNHSPLDGKLKSLVHYNTLTGDTIHAYYFYYDTISGALVKMKRDDDDSVFISKIDNYTIKLSFHYYDSFLNNSSEVELYAYLHSNGYIRSISYFYPEPFNPDSNSYRFVFKSDNSIDSIFVPYVPTPDVNFYFKYFDIVSDSRNYTQVIESTERHFTFGIPHIDTITTIRDISYATCASNIAMPGQHIFSSGWYLDGTIGPLYVLNVAGYNSYKPNKNMIDSASGHHYSYEFDLLGRITGIQKSPNQYFLVSYN